MLPNSKEYLTRAGHSPPASAYILIGLFLAGVIIIQFVSAFIHQYIPSHVVDCAHTHEPESDPERGESQLGGQPDHRTNGSSERTPLLRPNNGHAFKSTPAIVQRTQPASKIDRPESLRTIFSRRLSSLMGGVKATCDEDGPCFGFSQKCGRECTKVLLQVSPPPSAATNEVPQSAGLPQHSGITAQLGAESWPGAEINIDSIRTVSDPGYSDEITEQHAAHPTTPSTSAHNTHTPLPPNVTNSHVSNNDSHSNHNDHHHSEHEDDTHSKLAGDTHHHHVPQNAFLSIGLQTSLAIALHKLPEGFITYATNHANPTLGFTVFLALFIHNIVEGFAMALPLYLALNSRWKAMFWSSLLGGISQPLGAGLAALWIWASGHTNHNTEGPSWGVYGGMFAATAGVMTSVALQLFSEGLGLSHSRGMGIGFAIGGMGLMGLSFALTA